MNEADTRAELIDPKLAAAGWSSTEGARVLREFKINDGRIQIGGTRAKPLIADYILTYRGRKLAVIEAKSNEQEVSEGVGQAKNYAEKMQLATAYSTNGKQIYQICMRTGQEGVVDRFPTPDELWPRTFGKQLEWQKRFDDVPYEDVGGSKKSRYYQEIAINRVMEAVAGEKPRILLTLATGTGKTFIAFQIAWKLFHSKWNLRRDGSRRPRILFLADRNILADQAFNAFSAFPEDALVRIKPSEIRKKGGVPTNGSIFFTIFQTFMSGPNETPYFGDYPKDYFDFIVIDECHRGGANDESNWREIMEYFSPAAQLGLTATPRREDNVNTYKYFGEPVYIYSLKEGINDGFLTPFKVKRIKTTLDDYFYTSDDYVVEGEIEEGKLYTEPDFNRTIEIEERERKRVRILLSEEDGIEPSEKTLVFGATQAHAALLRDLINQNKTIAEPNYCVRVTANDGELGEQYLREFQDNEKSIPTILTTSQKLSTGVDARNVRNIALMRRVNSMIEFKQIIGRGTRLFDGKDFFTIYDFVDAYHHFADPDWDGEPVDVSTGGDGEPKEPRSPREPREPRPEPGPDEPPRKVKVKLGGGKELEIQHMVHVSYWSAKGPISAEQFMKNLFGELPKFFSNEAELRKIWKVPATRRALLQKLADAGYGKSELTALQKLVNAEKSDIFDVLEYVSYAVAPITRQARVNNAKAAIFSALTPKQKEFVEFVLQKYVESGVEELDQEKLPDLLTLKYKALTDAEVELGGVSTIKAMFVDFQKHLYEQSIA
ncbi:MAG: Type restriction-modification system, restriction subunit [Acidobacteriales bacterium]|nr:Type restriction-modification system, restriction subunit [Terriglobales bacterium]